ncbi:MAG TPA: response regulator [Polyangiaceae bacterium]|jgi:DNA-binding response OmpR family regulator
MTEPPARKLVMVVDDDASVRTMVARALQAKGYEVQEAADGMAASELLGRMSRAPDLLICDVMMPTVDGFSLARLVKSQPALRTVPIIFLTARSSPRDVVQGIALGARHYVQKPFSVVDLLDKVAKTIR